tara:strand:- start:88 stop:411 length:324 start_codon:yes stop_codon:yes gene_type:complete
MGLNNLNIMGNLGRDPERVNTSGDLIVARFSVAVTEKKEDETTWFKCVAFGKKAEYILSSCQKGTQVFIEGPHRSQEYNDKKSWVLHVNRIIALNNKKERHFDSKER